MALQMDRREMIKMLHELDNTLKSRLEIEICGASCAILNHGLKRASTDIDIMRSSASFTEEDLLRAIHTVALHNGTEPLWINDTSRELFKYIPEDYKPDTEPVKGETFKLLKPKVISKADFVITKLARYDHIRQWDISDLKALRLSEDDVRAVYRKLDAISLQQHADALMIEGHFKAIRSDLVKDEDDSSYSNARQIAEYAFKRYGIKSSGDEIADWQSSIDNLTKPTGAMIAKIDLNAAAIIKKGGGKIAECDKNYRINRGKNLDYGNNL
jgi:hypothetical protein